MCSQLAVQELCSNSKNLAIARQDVPFHVYVFLKSQQLFLLLRSNEHVAVLRRIVLKGYSHAAGGQAHVLLKGALHKRRGKRPCNADETSSCSIAIND